MMTMKRITITVVDPRQNHTSLAKQAKSVTPAQLSQTGMIQPDETS
jgi:hypothetical protein